MEEKDVSTFGGFALTFAYFRGYHAENHNPKIFDDFLANKLLTEEERTSLDRGITNAFPDRANAIEWYMQEFSPLSLTISRSRYTEDCLEKASKQSVQQYVILGAGLDSFAFRRIDMLEKLQVFEIDHPATQAFKLQRIAELGWEKPANLHFIPADFREDNLETALRRSSYDSKNLTFFSWLGVTYYLPREAVFATLRSISDIAPPGSSIVFDYFDADAFDPLKSSQRMKIGHQIAQQGGHPLITGFDPSTLAVEIANIGLSLKENISPDEIENRFFQGCQDNYHAYDHAHYAWAVVE